MRAGLAGFTVAVSHRSKQNGEWQDVTDGFFRCTAWRSVAENAAHTLKRGCGFATGRPERHGRPYEWRAHGLYLFRDGRIAECRVLPEDQYAFDEIWSQLV